jgi:hypothetical protein
MNQIQRSLFMLFALLILSAWSSVEVNGAIGIAHDSRGRFQRSYGGSGYRNDSPGHVIDQPATAQVASSGVGLKIDDATRVLMRKEKDELNIYARTNFGVYMNWVTFYFTVSVVAMGWLATKQIPSRPVVRVVTTMFLVVSVLALAGCLVAIQHFRELSDREATIVAALNEVGTHALIPLLMYEATILLFTGGCTAVLTAWWSFHRYTRLFLPPRDTLAASTFAMINDDRSPHSQRVDPRV